MEKNKKVLYEIIEETFEIAKFEREAEYEVNKEEAAKKDNDCKDNK